MRSLKEIGAPGTGVYYSQAGSNLPGRSIEKVTGQSFEQPVAALVCEPLGLSHSFFARDDIMTRRFAVGHNGGEDGLLAIARPGRHSRGDNPGGGIASSVAHPLPWGRLPVGDGGATNGVPRPPPTLPQSQKR